MAGPTTFPTVQRMIKMGYRDAGIIARGDDPSSDMYAEGLVRITDMVNLWLTQGIKIFTLQDISIPLVQGQYKYTVGPGLNVNMTKPLRGLQAYFLNSSGIRRPLIVLSWEEWLRLPQVNQQGAISSYFIDKQATELDVYFWMPPDASDVTGTGHVLFQTQLTQYTQLTDQTQFPQEWFMALRWGLADEVCTGQPKVIMDRCQQKANSYREALENWDVEDAPSYFAQDQRATYSSRGFT